MLANRNREGEIDDRYGRQRENEGIFIRQIRINSINITQIKILKEEWL